MSFISDAAAQLQHIESQLEDVRALLAASAASDRGGVGATASACVRQSSDQADVGRSRLDARQHAFQQRIGDLRRAVQLLEEGLQHGECRRNTDQLRALQTLTERSYRTCMVAHDEHFKPVRWPQNGAPVYLKGQYSDETLRKALDIVNSSMWPEFPAQGPPSMYACRGPFHCEKTAGDCACSFWIRKHMQHSGLNWLTNELQVFL